MCQPRVIKDIAIHMDDENSDKALGKFVMCFCHYIVAMFVVIVLCLLYCKHNCTHYKLTCGFSEITYVDYTNNGLHTSVLIS